MRIEESLPVTERGDILATSVAPILNTVDDSQETFGHYFCVVVILVLDLDYFVQKSYRISN